MIRPQHDALSFEIGTCNTALLNQTSDRDPPVVLGLSFLRSVYVAYRFPTPDCQRAFFGFAYPKGANRTREQKTQKPKTTPALYSQCLQLTTPSSTPTATRSMELPFRTLDGAQRSPLPGEKTWKVYAGGRDEQVTLRGADEI
jgi:hypothetical protein